MKKYKRKTALIAPAKVAIATLSASIVMILIGALFGIHNEYFIICNGIVASLLISYLFIILSVGQEYSYFENYIQMSYLSIKYQKIVYNKFDSIIVSNASYNTGFGYELYGNVPMQYKRKDKSGITKVTYPYITLHKSQYPVYEIVSGMSSRDLFKINNQDIYCLGICWFDSFNELLQNSDSTVYILEDVYLRFKSQFDIIFIQHKQQIDRFYIITNRCIGYKNYREGEMS